ncbi:hypothetical protein [Thomasclavelia cocleata]|uniref:hypothetical protein n=1 Tax=Thomasclavelia cocleata TaxID=69824 RepID=UPI00241C214C|nr:hypothetical protein [Thomasclavelia cocleata]
MYYSENTFHKIHCVSCGEIRSVNNFAFDVGAILKKGCKNTDFEALTYLEFKLYLTIEEFKGFFYYKTDTYYFNIENLKLLLLRLCGEKDFETLYQKTIDVNDLAELANKISSGNIGYENRAYLSDLAGLCKKYDNNLKILKFKIKTNYIKDDQDLRYCNKVTFYFNNISEDTKPICKECGEPYFELSGLHKEYIITMAGTTRTGKTAYLAALVTALEKNRETNHILEMKVSNDIYWDNFKEQVLDKYKKGNKYENTTINNEDKIPLFMLGITVNKGTYNFIFIDMPGEVYEQEKADFQDGKFIINNKKIANYTDVIFLCITSNQISKKYLIEHPEQYEGDSTNEDMMEVIDRSINTIKSIPNYTDKIVALLITKSDLLTDKYSDLLHFNYEYIENYMDKNDDIIDFDKLNQYMQKSIEYLSESGQIVNGITSVFNKLNGFAVAAYQKNNEDRLEIVQSNVLAPFAWLLAVLELMDVGESKKIILFLKKIIKVTDLNRLYFKNDKEEK